MSRPDDETEDPKQGGSEAAGGPGFTLGDAPSTADPADALPPIDFATFVLSLATSAMFHMGLTPDPASGETAERNLPLARQTIDSIEMLQEKTRGNLDDEEAKLIQSVLYELRMGFVSIESKSD